MWKHAVLSVRGSAHCLNGTPCQDSSGALLVGQVLIVALSDGAGSAKFSDVGSKIVIETAQEFFAQIFSENPAPENLILELDVTDGQQLLDEIRQRLACEAERISAELGDFASTMVVGVLHNSGSRFYQVGDGAWCASRNNVIGAVTWPQHGEFVSQTDFVTTATASESLQFSALAGSVDFVVGMTDGMERLALDLQNFLPHRGFCEPLIRGLLSSECSEFLNENLTSFLNSDRVIERTNDDKTLALIAYVGNL